MKTTMTFFGMLGLLFPLFGQTIPQLTVTESYFFRLPAEKWKNAGNARKIDFAFGKLLDLDLLAEKPGQCMDEGEIHVLFHSSGNGVIPFGLGADWWCEAEINGTLCFSTMQSGNGSDRFSIRNHLFSLPVKKGKNLLIFKVRRGSAGWKLICGPEKFPVYQGKIPWEKGPVPPAAPPSGQSYRLIVLGDMHYDTDENVYHADYREPNARLNRIQRREFTRNAAMWQERCPRMLRAAAKQITPDTLAIIQVGDLIQGDCGNPEVHSRMLTDTLALLKRTFRNLPVLTVAGNHDVRGTGAEQAYRRTMPKYHSGELRKPVSGTTFYTLLGGDLFLFIDFNDPDLDGIYEAMNRKARYRFVVCHGPVLPSDNASARWFLFGQNDPWRRTLHQLFMSKDVIVLTGHVHDLELTECVTTEGRITQLMANSVWSKEKLATLQTVFSQPEEYGKNQTSPDGKELFQEYRNVITRYWKAKGAGYFVLDVTPGKITANYYGGDAEVPAKEIRLR